MRKENTVEKRARILWVLVLLAVLAGCSKGTQDVTGPGGFNEGSAALAKGGGGKPPPPPADPAIAYIVSNRRGDKLMVMNADGTNQATIFQGARYTYGPTRPSWSPEGNAIAFVYDWKLHKVPVIIENGVPQGGETTCLSEETIYGAVEWSPGGPKAGTILYVDSGHRNLTVMSADDGTSEVLYSTTGIGIECPVWNSDGNQIAFLDLDVVDGAPEWTLRILDVSSDPPEVIHSDVLEDLPAANAMCMDWARTQNKLVYGTGLPGEGTIYTIDIYASGEDWLNTVCDGWVPGWSPDDTKLVYQTTRLYIGIYDLCSGQAESLTGGGWPDWRR
jgi:hypothetical protein